MALNAQGYFNCLKSYLNTNHYGEPQASTSEVVLKERVFGQSGSKPIEYKVSLQTTGETLAIKLDTKKSDFAASLSGGQRKLLEMARALMTDPVLVMLDEPMAGVNPALTQSLLEHIKDLKKNGTTVLFVEHDMHMVRNISDWVIVMAEGKIVAEGPPAIVMKDQAVIDAYLGAHADTDLGTVAIKTIKTTKAGK